MGTARFVTNYKWCIFIFWCRAMQASKHTAYTSIESQMIGRSSWAKYAAFRSATMVGMSDIEIPISYVWRVTPQIYMHTQPSVEISWYSIYTFLLLESCCYWVNENTADRFQGKMPGGTKPELWWQGLSGDLLNLPTCYLHLWIYFKLNFRFTSGHIVT